MESTMTLSHMADLIVVGTFIVVVFSVTTYSFIELVTNIADDIHNWRKKRKEMKQAKNAETEH